MRKPATSSLAKFRRTAILWIAFCQSTGQSTMPRAAGFIQSGELHGQGAEKDHKDGPQLAQRLPRSDFPVRSGQPQEDNLRGQAEDAAVPLLCPARFAGAPMVDSQRRRL